MAPSKSIQAEEEEDDCDSDGDFYHTRIWSKWDGLAIIQVGIPLNLSCWKNKKSV